MDKTAEINKWIDGEARHCDKMMEDCVKARIAADPEWHSTPVDQQTFWFWQTRKDTLGLVRERLAEEG